MCILSKKGKRNEEEKVKRKRIYIEAKHFPIRNQIVDGETEREREGEEAWCAWLRRGRRSSEAHSYIFNYL